jgi:hypothetical protein
VFGVMLVLGFLTIAGFFTALIVLIVYAVQRGRRRTQERHQAMYQLGWVYAPPSPWLSEVAAKTFARGRPVTMAAGPHRGREICCLDYEYTTTSGDTTTTHRVHLVALNLPGALPPIAVSGESRLLRFLAGRDLELENRLFNDTFRISCADDRYASAVLHPRMMHLLMMNNWLDWRIEGNALVSWAAGPWLAAEAVARLDLLCRIADLIPNFVHRDYGHPVY